MMNDKHVIVCFYLVVLNFEGPKHKKKSQKYQHTLYLLPYLLKCLTAKFGTMLEIYMNIQVNRHYCVSELKPKSHNQ